MPPGLQLCRLSQAHPAVVRLPTEPAKRHPKVASPGAMIPSCSPFTMLSKSRLTRPTLLTQLKPNNLQNTLFLSGDSEDQGSCSNTFSVPGPKAKEEVLNGVTDWKVQFDIDVTDGASLGYRTSLPFLLEIAVVSGKGSRHE